MKFAQQASLAIAGTVSGLWLMTEEGLAATTATTMAPSSTETVEVIAGLLMTSLAVMIYVYKTK
ncbi:hypothetical protein [Weissella confusa]|uniref:hypothetical protein n=1 Tax=Weissella confusa TaxID=1583 RepID=UPI00223BDE34|nr:hypothetical protein [Weissella confusa]MCS9989583.1 hypothetical protein [Weissella confusa]